MGGVPAMLANLSVLYLSMIDIAVTPQFVWQLSLKNVNAFKVNPGSDFQEQHTHPWELPKRPGWAASIVQEKTQPWSIDFRV